MPMIRKATQTILFLFLLGPLSGFAQGFISFPFDSTYWRVEAGASDGCGFPPCYVQNSYVYYFGDTVSFNANLYHKVHANVRSYVSGACCWGLMGMGGLKGFLREDTTARKVYYVPNDGVQQEFLLYDYSLAVGDSLFGYMTSFFGDTFIVTNITTVLIKNIPQRKFSLQPVHLVGPPSPYYYYIEGVGSGCGLVSPFDPFFETGSNLSCVVDSSGVIYRDPDYNGSDCSFIEQVPGINFSKNDLAVYPQPFNKELNVRAMNIELTDVTVYDGKGRKIFYRADGHWNGSMQIETSSWAAGMYLLEVHSGNSVIERKIMRIE